MCRTVARPVFPTVGENLRSTKQSADSLVFSHGDPLEAWDTNPINKLFTGAILFVGVEQMPRGKTQFCVNPVQTV